MPGSHFLLSDTVLLTMKIQQFHFSITAGQLIAWGIALVVGLLTRLLIGRRMAFGILGTFIAALFGVWIATSIIIIDMPYDVSAYDIPLIKACIGAIALEIVWYLLTYSGYRTWASRRKYNKNIPKIPNT